MTAHAEYRRTVDLLDDLGRRPIVPARDVEQGRIAFLLRRLGDPHKKFRSIHVAGSTGKGSTTTMIGSVLQAAGFRTGYFRSPHLWSYTERIAVDGQDISEEAWASVFDEVWPVALAMSDGTIEGYSLGRPSLSEIWLAMASLYFLRSGVQWAAIETGLGGRLDATNVLPSDAAVVTNISLEHTKILGSTVQAIAREKAAIIKPGSVAVTAAAGDALPVVQSYADRAGARLIEVPRDVCSTVVRADITGQTVRLQGLGHQVEAVLSLPGPFQAINAATAAACIWGLQARGLEVSDAQVAQGLGGTRLPGRFEVMGGSPNIILDGAHAPAAAQELRNALDKLIPNEPVVLLFAAMADKNVEQMARSLGPRADAVVVTSAPGTDRSCPVSRLRTAFEGSVDTVVAIEEVALALQTAREMAEGKTLVVCGSLYLVGWARHALLDGVAAR